jgi:hypothetical protein
VPGYIGNDAVTYPKISTVQWAPLKFDTPKLIEKEVRAVKTLMNYINLYDIEQRIVMIQVENEPDHRGNTPTYWAGGQPAAVLRMIDTLGQVIHASNSNMVTRVNLLGGYSDTTTFKNLKGVDIIGADLYDEVLTSYKSRLTELDCSWNVNHTPENGGQYPNTINLACAAFEKGDGYLLYELRTTGPKWFTGGYDFGFFYGTLTNDWVQRPFYNDVKTFNEMLYKADKKIARCPKGLIATFNQANSATTVSETKTIGTYSVTYNSTNGGEAIALVDELGEIILMSHNDNSTFAITNLPTGMVASIGKYDDANQWQATKTGTLTNNSITLMTGEVARIYPNASIPVITAYTQKNGGAWLQNNSVTVCSGSSFSFGPQPNNGTWKWSGPNGFTSTSRQIDFLQTTPSNAGTYTATYTNLSGNSTIATFTALVHAAPTLVTTDNSSICQGKSINLVASGSGVYAWSSGQSLSSSTEWHFNTDGTLEGWGLANQLNGSVANGVITATLTGNDPFMFSDWTLKIPAATQTKVRIRMKNSTSGTQAMFKWLTSTDGDWWTNDKVVYFPIKANDTDYTEYVLDMTQKVDWKDVVTMLRFDPVESGAATGTVSIDWIKITSDQSFTVTPQASTTYTVTTTDKNSCITTNSIAVTVNPIPTISAGLDVPICSGKSATLTATGGSSYLWSNNSTNASISVSPTVTTSYSVTGTTANCSATDAVVVTVNTLPIISPNIKVNAGAVVSVNDTTILSGQSLILSPLPIVATGWKWTGPNSYSASTRQISFPTIAYNQAGIYTATYTDGNGCSASFNQKIGIKILQTINLKQGWNLISTNVMPTDSSIATVFANIDVQEIKNMDAFWRKGQTTVFNSLQSIESGKGYLVYMNTGGTLQIIGTPSVESRLIASLHSGWQLIGCPYQTTTPFSTLLNATNTKTVKSFEGFWIPSVVPNSISSFVPGNGYFLQQ